MRRRVVVWLTVLAAWTLLAAAFAVGSSLAYMISYRPPRWGLTFSMALVEWYAWAALTPLVVWLARRLALSRHAWMRRAIVLALLGIPVAGLKIVISQILRSVAAIPGYAVPGNLVAQYLIYWGIIAIAHAAAYYRSESQRELRASRAEAHLAETRLQLLKMQLHPHFLFNTLNTISELVHENPAAAERMISGLSHLLRETLDAGTVDVIPLSRELDLLARYVDIQRARFGARLKVNVAAGTAAREALVPIFILQPLLENAIKHGLAAHAGAGRIDIHAHLDRGRVIIDIDDDGPGFGEGEVQHGVGLSNTRARLRELYGNAHTFTVAEAPVGGTRVTLAFPASLDAAPEQRA